MTARKPIVTRYKNNPILTKDDIPYKVETVHNAAVVKHGDEYVMLFRSHLDNGRCILGLADSDDGFNFVARSEPFMVPSTDSEFGEYEVDSENNSSESGSSPNTSSVETW